MAALIWQRALQVIESIPIPEDCSASISPELATLLRARVADVQKVMDGTGGSSLVDSGHCELSAKESTAEVLELLAKARSRSTCGSQWRDAALDLAHSILKEEGIVELPAWLSAAESNPDSQHPDTVAVSQCANRGQPIGGTLNGSYRLDHVHVSVRPLPEKIIAPYNLRYNATSNETSHVASTALGSSQQQKTIEESSCTGYTNDGTDQSSIFDALKDVSVGVQQNVAETFLAGPAAVDMGGFYVGDADSYVTHMISAANANHWAIASQLLQEAAGNQGPDTAVASSCVDLANALLASAADIRRH